MGSAIPSASEPGIERRLAHRRCFSAIGAGTAGAFLIALLAGCAAPRKLAYTADELRAEIHNRAPALADNVIIPFDVAPRDVALARQAVASYIGPGEQVRGLVDALFDPTVFGLRYAPIVTATAAQTLQTAEGNCLSLASVFVGLARGLGLKAYYLDASALVGEVTHMDSSLVVNAGHITAVVEVDKWRWYLDFDRTLGSRLGSFRALDDIEAVAHFYNNRGYERIEWARQGEQSIDWEAAARDFETAAAVQPNFARAWNNLGIAYARLERQVDAERAYTRAIAADPKVSAPYNNLGTLYLHQGKVTEAVAALRIAVRLEPDSAHAYLNLGRALITAHDVPAAVEALERAAALHDKRASALLGKLGRYQSTHALERLER